MRTGLLMVPPTLWLRHFDSVGVYHGLYMGTFYRDKTRYFNGRCLVLCAYEHTFARERCFDVIMISVDASHEIPQEFAKHCKTLERRDPTLLFYLPECNKPYFDYRGEHAE